ncbi:DUF4097 family beta strand repeat-containing protein [Planococcus dechangensis]|uniref:DUF4097 family beta strand repeat-containing protein n=1 Tax=Planococcus dechangensis TaxID=1176255 RepID=A0ABV9MHE7_9BACL
MKTLVKVLIIIAAIILVGVIIVLVISYNSDPARQEVLEEQTFDGQIEDMEITVENARVDLVPSEDDTARLVLSGNSDDFTLTTDLSGGRLIVDVKDRSQFLNFDFNRTYSLQVSVPENGLDSLTVESDNGTIQARDIEAAELSLEANNGRIDLESVNSETVNVETDNGAVDITEMEANMAIRSSNGRIIFNNVSGELQARANNGRIELSTETLDFPVNFETNNGRIEIRTDSEPSNARIRARVDNGSINVYGRENEESVFGDGNVLIHLESNNGRIVVE